MNVAFGIVAIIVLGMSRRTVLGNWLMVVTLALVLQVAMVALFTASRSPSDFMQVAYTPLLPRLLSWLH